jgi:hypothetical protein
MHSARTLTNERQINVGVDGHVINSKAQLVSSLASDYFAVSQSFGVIHDFLAKIQHLFPHRNIW